jgi:Tfp pilus assembly protein PilE
MPIHVRQNTFTASKANGFSLAEALVGLTILAVVVATSITLFNQYVQLSSSARLKDQLSTIITKDSERLRSASNELWPCTTSCPPGTLSYSPPFTSCANRALAQAAATVNPVFSAGSVQLQIPSDASFAAKNAIITRSISHQENIIVARYTSSTPVSIDYISYILPAAQGWCQ